MSADANYVIINQTLKYWMLVYLAIGGLGICENCRLLCARNTPKINTKAMHTRSKVPTAYKITSSIVNWVFRSRSPMRVLQSAIYLLSFCIKLEVSWEWNYTLWRNMWVGGGGVRVGVGGESNRRSPFFYPLLFLGIQYIWVFNFRYTVFLCLKLGIKYSLTTNFGYKVYHVFLNFGILHVFYCNFYLFILCHT